jgi:hypothetical protein
VEVSFGAGSCGGVPCTWPTTPEGVIAPEQRPIQLRVQIDPAALRYDLSNDYSNDLDRPGPTVCETITLYRDGVLIFGVEPDGTTVEPKTDGGVPPVTEDAGADAGVAGQGGQGGHAGQGGQGGASGADAGGGQSGVVDAGPPDVDASLPEPEPAPLPDAGLGTDASVAP